MINWAGVEGKVSVGARGGGLETVGGMTTCFGGDKVILDGGGETSFVWGGNGLAFSENVLIGGGGAV